MITMMAHRPKKPAMIIDVLAGPGDEDEEELPPDEEEEGEIARRGRQDPDALIQSIEQQLMKLRSLVAGID